MRSLMMDQWGSKHVGVCVLKHCDSNELCAFIGLHCGKLIIVHGMGKSKTSRIYLD
jgi:hypothetical protein